MKQSYINSAARSFGSAVKSIKSAVLLSLCTAASFSAQANDARTPELPEVCGRIAAPEGTHVVFHVFAVGVQIYHWNGTAWVFFNPAAILYADAGHQSEVGIHFGTPTGPAWQTTSGSMVIEQRVDGCTPDPTAIQWVLLHTLTSQGGGVLQDVSFVQRVNTVAGIAPTEPGAFVGEERQMPYTAEYVFYKK
jgi:hypothetical protein